MARNYIGRKKRTTVIQRAGERCEYCRSMMKYRSHSFAIEHILPIALGGTDDINNLALSCGACNSHKYTKIEAPDPTDGKISPLFNPRIDHWQDHFSWSSDFHQIIGKTPIGRATISCLQLNRLSVINLRQLTKITGEHPPAEE